MKRNEMKWVDVVSFRWNRIREFSKGDENETKLNNTHLMCATFVYTEKESIFYFSDCSFAQQMLSAPCFSSIYFWLLFFVPVCLNTVEWESQRVCECVLRNRFISMYSKSSFFRRCLSVDLAHVKREIAEMRTCSLSSHFLIAF